MKKLSIVLLICLLLASLIACDIAQGSPDTTVPTETTAPADDVTASPAEDFLFEENADGGYTLTKYIGHERDVVVPSKIDGKNVSAIGEKAFSESDIIRQNSLLSVTIPSTVKTIGDYAFERCKTLAAVVLPDTVNVISDRAFTSSTITAINTPRDLTTIGEYAFFACSKLTAFELTDSITSIGAYAFNNCRSIEEIKIPSSLKTVSEYAFAFTGPKIFEISEGVEIIEEGAFCGVRIDNIVLPSTVKSIGDKAFYQSMRYL